MVTHRKGIVLGKFVVLFLFSTISISGCGRTSVDFKGLSPVNVDDPEPMPTPITEGILTLNSPMPEMSFISTDQITLSASSSSVDSNHYMRWTIKGWEVFSETNDEYILISTGEEYSCISYENIDNLFHPQPPVAGTQDRKKRLYYEIIVELIENSITTSIIETYIVQDYIDQCRQEYVDFQRNTVPTRNAIDSSYGSINFDLQEFIDNRTEYTKKVIYVQGVLTDGLEAMRTGLGNVSMDITSGYRWPSTQQILHPNTPEGNHQYGVAADVDVPSNTETEWKEMRKCAKDAGACVEPADFGHPGYFNYTYIHVDWRGICPTNW